MFTPVDPVPAQPPQYGLVRTAVVPNDQVRWENGISWRPERCIASSVYDACLTGDLPAPSGNATPSINYYRPFVIRVQGVCARREGPDAVDEARVRRQLEAVTPYRVARELWTGEWSAANPYATPDSGGVANVSNRRLAQVNGVEAYDDGAYTPYDGLGTLEELARRNVTASNSGASMGQDVWIHMPLEVVPLVWGALVNTGNIWQTKGGARVVFDAGYLGTNPQGTAVGARRWMYATGPVTVRLSPIETRSFFDQRTNRMVVSAERMAAAYFDSCVHHGLAVATPAVA